MVQVPEYQRNVALRPNLRQDVSVQATPQAFGSAVGAGMEQLGQGVASIANAVDQVKKMESAAIRSDKRNSWAADKDDLLYNPDNGYLNTQGKQSIDGYEAYQQKVEKLKDKYVEGMPTLEANQFKREIEPFEQDALRTGMKKKAGEAATFFVQEHVAAADTFANQATQSPLDAGRWNGFIGKGLLEIDGRAQKSGWGAEQLAAEKRNYVSAARREAALQIAMNNPIAAVKYATDHVSQLTPQDNIVLLDRLKPDVAAAASKDAMLFSASKPAANQFAAQGLSRDQYALLGVISGEESPGYDVMNGGRRFSDFAAHPGFVGAGGTTTASGRYQFVAGTWQMAAKALGLTDFSPASQDRAAAWLAQKDYRTNTGRDLNADIAAGNYSAVRAGLGTTWEGLAKISDVDFAKKMNIARSGAVRVGGATMAGGPIASPSLPAGQQQPQVGPTFSPETEGVLSGLPQAYADDIRRSATQGVASYQSQQAAQQKAIQTAQTDAYRLRIANGDTTLSAQDLNDDTVIDNGDKAALISSLNEKNKEAIETQRNVEAFRAGRFVVDPYSEKGRKANDEVWSSASNGALPEQREPMLMEQVKQTGVVPTPVINALRFGSSGGNVREISSVMQLAGRITAIDPAAITRAPGGGEIADDEALFRHYTQDMGIAPLVAAQRLVDRRDPEKVKARAALMESKPIKDAIESKATDTNVRSIFSTGMFSFNPTLGTSGLQAAAIVADYADFLKEAVYDAGGDVDAGEALAVDRFKRLYGTSEFSMGGPKVVSRLPPEKAYPSDANGSWTYIRQQLSAGLSAEGVGAKEAFLVPDKDTERDFAAGQPPRYQAYYRDAQGVLQHYRKPFYATPSSEKEIAASKKAETDRRIAEIEAHRQQNIKDLQAGRDRNANLDQFLAGPLQIPQN